MICEFGVRAAILFARSAMRIAALTPNSQEPYA